MKVIILPTIINSALMIMSSYLIIASNSIIQLIMISK